jgi:hypothetical protein
VCRLFYGTQNPKQGALREFRMRSRNTRTLTGKRRTREAIRLAERLAAKRRQSAPAESRAPPAWNSRRRPRARRRREKLLVVAPTPTLGGLACTCARGPKSSTPVELPPISPGVRRRATCRRVRQLAGARDATPAHRQQTRFLAYAKPFTVGGSSLHPGFECGQSVSSGSLCSDKDVPNSAALRLPPPRVGHKQARGFPVILEIADRR